MADNLLDNEFNKFSEIGDTPVVDIAIINGTAIELDEDVRLETLEENKFDQIDGKPVVRVNVVSGTVGTLDADAIVTASVGRDTIRTKTGNVVSVRFGD